MPRVRFLRKKCLLRNYLAHVGTIVVQPLKIPGKSDVSDKGKKSSVFALCWHVAQVCACIRPSAYRATKKAGR
jgi:hypothetical protein